MQANVQANEIYFWGQEIAIHSVVRNIAKDQGTISTGLVERAVAEVIGLPLLIPDGCNYAELIQQVIKNRIQRRLPIEVDIG